MTYAERDSVESDLNELYSSCAEVLPSSDGAVLDIIGDAESGTGSRFCPIDIIECQLRAAERMVESYQENEWENQRGGEITEDERDERCDAWEAMRPRSIRRSELIEIFATFELA